MASRLSQAWHQVTFWGVSVEHRGQPFESVPCAQGWILRLPLCVRTDSLGPLLSVLVLVELHTQVPHSPQDRARACLIRSLRLKLQA